MEKKTDAIIMIVVILFIGVLGAVSGSLGIAAFTERYLFALAGMILGNAMCRMKKSK